MFSQDKIRTLWTYYRHSAEDKQENSVPIQREKAEKFSDIHNLVITQEFADEGKSGLSANRPAFKRLIEDWVLNPNVEKADYILVHDVSRWGRFQDPDEAAYWTMMCKQQGIKVIYIEEGFPDEDQLLNTGLQTHIKRYMAAEYSRQLSGKVFYGSAKVAEQGYSPGGTASYGLTRILLDENKRFVARLKPGEHKVIANQRVTFAPSNDQASETVKRIFDELIDNWRHPSKIAELLNDEGILTATGGSWNSSRIIQILSNERYAGTLVYNKTWKRLGSKTQRRNPVSEWVRCEGAFEGIVTLERFEIAQERLYWTLPHRHRYGINRINRAKREFKEFLLTRTENLDEDAKFNILQDFPVTFGLAFYHDNIAKRCFRIDEDQRKQDELLCISLDMFNDDKVEAVYKLPAKLFGIGDYLVVKDNDSSLQNYLVEKSETENVVGEIQGRLIAGRSTLSIS